MRCDRARQAMKPPRPMGVMLPSAPPVTMTSAMSHLMAWNASPMAWAEVEQAVETAVFGPISPCSMEMVPLAELEIILGMVNGLSRLGPRSMYTVCCSSQVISPPMPLPTIEPQRKRSSLEKSRPDSAMASLAAATANWAKRSR